MRFEFSDQIRKLLHFVRLWPLQRRFLLRRLCLSACTRISLIPNFDAMRFDLFFGFLFCFFRIQHVASRHLASAVI